MALSESVIFVLWAGGLLLLMPRMQKLWSGEGLADLERNWRRIWPYGEAALQGWLRASVAFYIGGWFVALAYAAAVLLPTAAGSIKPALVLAVWTGTTGLFVMVAIAIAIVLFNAPKRLVFPVLRSQEGMLKAWSRER